MKKCKLKQNSSCSLNMALRLLSSIKGLGIVIHGPIGCGNGYGNLITHSRLINDPHYIVSRDSVITFTNYNDEDLIFGGAEKLKNALEAYIQRYESKIICVLITCLPAINGDYYSNVIEQFENQSDKKILIVESQGLAHLYCHDVYENVTEQFFAEIIEKNHKDVNLLNVVTTNDDGMKDYREIYKLLIPLGIKPNFLPFYSDVEKIKNAGNACSSVYLCEVPGNPLTRFLKSRFNIDNIEQSPPIGIELTDKWLQAIGERFGRKEKAEGFIAKMHQHIQGDLNNIRERLKDKTVVITAGEGKLFPWAMLCKELGLSIKLLGSIYSPIRNKSFYENFSEVQIIEEVQWHQLRDYMVEQRPDFYFGEQGDIPEIVSLGIPIVMSTRFELKSFSLYGYESIIRIGNSLIDILNRSPKLSLSAKINLATRA